MTSFSPLFSEQFLQCKKLLADGLSQQALDQFQKLKASSLQEHRAILHMSGYCKLYLGDLEGAKSDYLRALKNFGDYIGIWRDLACLYYQSGEIYQWRQTYNKVDNLLKDLKYILSPSTKTRTSLILAKFQEEEGLCAPALEWYKEAVSDARESGDKSLYLRSLTQLIRSQAFLSANDGLGELYTELITLQPKDLYHDLSMEIEHSLMLAEMLLIGPNHAWTRVQHVIHNGKAIEADKRLILYDYLEESLLRGSLISEEATAWVSLHSSNEPFESYIGDLISNPSQLSIQDLNTKASQFSKAGLIRLLSLHISMEKQESKKAEYKRKLELITQSLDGSSRYFWTQRLRQAVNCEKKPILSFSPSKRSLDFEGKQLNLARKKGMLTLVEALAQHQQVSVDELIQNIWEAQYSPEHLHRLRMTVHRLNQDIFDLTSLPKVLEMNGQCVSVNPEVFLELRKEGLSLPQ